jgi:hypothetical protein
LVGARGAIELCLFVLLQLSRLRPRVCTRFYRLRCPKHIALEKKWCVGPKKSKLLPILLEWSRSSLQPSCALLLSSASSSSLLPVMKSLNRMIAILEVEAGMVESHVNKLGQMANVIKDEEHRRELLRLADEEETRAQNIRHQICLLQVHLVDDSPKVA